MTLQNEKLRSSESSLKAKVEHVTTSIRTELESKMFGEKTALIQENDKEMRKLRMSFTNLQDQLEQAKEELRTSSIAYDALKVSHEQISVDLGIAIGRQQEAAANNETDEIIALKKATKSRIAEELEKADTNAQRRVEDAVANTRAEMMEEMEIKLEATEKRSARAEKELQTRLSCALEECEAARKIADEYKSRELVSQEYTQTSNCPPCLHSDANTDAADSALNEEHSKAMEKYEVLLDTVKKHSKTLRKDPGSVRKQMRTAAIVRECSELSDAMVLGRTAPSRLHATADHDTGIDCLPSLSDTHGLRNARTKCYYTGAAACLDDDTGCLQRVRDRHIDSSESIGSDTAIAQVNTSDGTNTRTEALIDATKEDLNNALSYSIFIHKYNAKTGGVVRVDSQGKCSALS
jgi:hypothetical protein